MTEILTLKDFYKQNPVDLSFLTCCSWRQFRFLLPSGRFWKLPYQIRDNKTFNSWLLKKRPLDVYYSTSCWLAPTIVGAKCKIISKNLFISSDLVFDIDGENNRIRSIEKARKESIKLLELLDSQNIHVKYIAFSGSKGFHIVCEDPFKLTITSTLEREIQIKEKSSLMAQRVLHSGIKIDSRVTVDTRRILRVPGTINSKSGYCCRILTRKDLLYNSAKEIIKNTKKIDKSALMILRGNDQKFTFLRKILGLHRFRARSNPTLYHYATFISNKVVPTKLYVPIIEFRKINESNVVNQLLKIMDIYKLSDAFLFKGDYYFAIIPFALQKRRVEKILTFADSLNLPSFRKYHQTFTRISSKVDMDFKTVTEKPIFIRHIKTSNQEKIASKSHQYFLIKTGILYKKFSHTIGSSEYILRHTLIEN